MNPNMRISATNGSDISLLAHAAEGGGHMDGQTAGAPKAQMMKFRQRYGCMFECGWLPPTGPIAVAAMATVVGLGSSM